MLFENICILVKPEMLKLYFEFFKELLTEEKITKTKQYSDEVQIETTDGRWIRFVTKDSDFCGYRCDIYLNMTGDERFEEEKLLPAFCSGARMFDGSVFSRKEKILDLLKN